MIDIPYTILPFQFKRTNNNDVLMVNEAGDFTFISNEDFLLFVKHQLQKNSNSYKK